MDKNSYDKLEKIRISTIHEKSVLNAYLDRLKNFTKKTGNKIFDPLINAINDFEWVKIYKESLKYVKELTSAEITNYDKEELNVIVKTQQNHSIDKLTDLVYSSKENEIFTKYHPNIGKILSNDVKNKSYNVQTIIDILNSTKKENIVFAYVDEHFPAKFKRGTFVLCESKLSDGVKIDFGEDIRNISLDREHLINLLELTDRIIFKHNFDLEDGLCIDYDISTKEEITEYELKQITKEATTRLIKKIQLQVDVGTLFSWIQLFEIEEQTKKIYFDLFRPFEQIDLVANFRNMKLSENERILIYNTIKANIQKIVKSKERAMKKSEETLN